MFWQVEAETGRRVEAGPPLSRWVRRVRQMRSFLEHWVAVIPAPVLGLVVMLLCAIIACVIGLFLPDSWLIFFFAKELHGQAPGVGIHMLGAVMCLICVGAVGLLFFLLGMMVKEFFDRGGM